MIWIARISLFLLVVAALIPLIPSGAWYIRLFDFPKVQLVCCLLVPMIAILIHQCATHKFTTEIFVLISITVVTGVVQLAHIAPFTKIWQTEIATCDSQENIKLLVANIQYTNTTYDEIIQVINSHSPDLLLIIEIDDQWKTQLKQVREQYDHHVEEVRGNGLGIALWSRLPFRESEIRYLISDRRPSVFATIQMLDDQYVRFIGVHPTPPGIDDETSGGRRDSRVRDAELILVAKEVAKDTNSPWIVAGDFNDVAWSETTQVFKDISKLKDPRIGRTLLNTYHADYPFLQFPIDQLFLSEGSTLQTLKRVPLPGSDHFGVVAEFVPKVESQSKNEEPASEVHTKGSELIHEGNEDSEAKGVSSSDHFHGQ